MTGIKVAAKKEVQIPLRSAESEDDEPVISKGLKRQIVFRLVVATLLILSTVFYAVVMDRPHRQELQQHPFFDQAIPDRSVDYTDRFVEFMKKFNKDYDDDSEMLKRFKAYEKHMQEVEQLNRKSDAKATYGESDLSDWTEEEFRNSLLSLSFYKRLREEATFIRKDPPRLERALPPPDFFDWRARNVVSPVKAQGKCGSCWAFAATATVEAAWAIAHGEMRNLSEQTLLDCDLEDNACDGGDEDKAFRYIHRNGLAYAADLPYVAHRQNTCDISGNTTKIEVAYFLHPDEQSMIDWLVGFGPVNIGISVTPDMRPYKGGVFTPSASDCKNKVIGLHALLITGYGTSDSGEKYWIVKNSWGNTWGVENGYIYFARGINACGIEDEPIGILA
ncbi:hypothetical protein Q1695_012060 [Nippostrongylus brasiliensis]|nr:hypothetical protein Q1695_012060 [Nippostrongylus brasiliensis]